MRRPIIPREFLYPRNSNYIKDQAELHPTVVVRSGTTREARRDHRLREERDFHCVYRDSPRCYNGWGSRGLASEFRCRTSPGVTSRTVTGRSLTGPGKGKGHRSERAVNMRGATVKGSVVSYVIVWAFLAVGTAYLNITNLTQWRTNSTAGRFLAVVAGAVCIAAVIRVGHGLGWWHFLYGPNH